METVLVTEAGRTIIDVGVVGAVCIMLVAALVWKEHISRRDIREEREAHKATLNAHLEDVKKFALIGESIRDQMAATEATMRAVLDLVKERGRP